MSILHLADFDDYFFAIHGHKPFPWQRRLLTTVVETGWPSALALPTASGKTAILDVAVFVLAMQAASGGPITTPRRIALVVDRRIVVDDVFRRAEKIAAALAEAPSGVLQTVAVAMRALGGESPLAAALLRGGIYREDRWARSPAQPVILCSTVDQVGSRLLHRGYGISSSMWPVHAGLLGNDTLVILDEAHCSRPFGETLAWIARFRKVGRQALDMPFAVVEMTATPHTEDEPFRLDNDDRREEVLQARLGAGKYACLVKAKPKEAGFVTSLMEQVGDVVEPGKTLLVVVNRVATARSVAEGLRKRQGKKAGIDADVILLTGRNRPVVRDTLLAERRQRIMAGRDRGRDSEARSLVVVATQCVEVGADLDVDVLVTECCPLDSLRQRLGRLDRLGELGESFVLIVCRAEQVWDGTGEPADDAVYGQSLARTWHWLEQQRGQAETIDLGTDALDDLLGLTSPEERALLTAPSTQAPIMFPAYCDLWAQTGPEPAASPDPAIFLHGPQRGEPEVRIVWRADLGAEPDTWADTVALCPPVTGESLAVRLSEAKRWLSGRGWDVEAADLEGQTSIQETQSAAKKGDQSLPFLVALRWGGPERSSIAQVAADLRPGDTLVVPVTYGGCDDWGWRPVAIDNEPVSDCADTARIGARRTAVLRLHPALLYQWRDAASLFEPFACHSSDELFDSMGQEIKAVLANLTENAKCPPEKRPLLMALINDRRLRIEPHPSGQGIVLVGRRRMVAGVTDFTDEDESSSAAGRAVSLFEHLNDVGRRTESFAKAVGLSPAIIDDLALAGRLHDLGKADPRFQAWLHNGDRLASMRSGLLAKSEKVPVNGRAIKAARLKAGYPEGGRHELLSVRLVQSVTSLLQKAHDPDLVLHLIEGHHGHCRAFAPVVVDDRPVSVTCDFDGLGLSASSATALERLGSGVSERFWGLIRRYGWWGLSCLEACLRLADHRASEAADNGGEE